MRHNSILDTIGKTPLIRLQRVTASLSCNVYAKCEFMNPGGSVKDRIALHMVERAEKEGRIRPGDTLIEATSGNTGIGLALVGAVKGYNVIITMPEKMSREKQVVLEALGAKIIRTPTEAASDSPESHISVARRLEKELPHAHILDQYSNPANPDVHANFTAEEILAELDGRVDMVVITAGTGGTLTGVARKLKQMVPTCQVIGVDPIGSILAGPGPIAPYKVEGIGYDFIPKVLDRSLVDRWVKTSDYHSFRLARRLIREEGLLCGGSSGSAMWAALKEAVHLQPGQNCVVILADGVRNYMTKFVDDRWMAENRFLQGEPIEGTVQTLLDQLRPQPLHTILDEAPLVEAITMMQKYGFSQIPAVNGSGELVGMIHEQDLYDKLCLHPTPQGVEENVRTYMGLRPTTVDLQTPIQSLQELISHSASVVIIDSNQKPLRILTKIDLIEWARVR